MLVMFSFGFICRIKGLPCIAQGPDKAVSEVTKSLYHENSLSPEFFYKIRSEISEMSRRSNLFVWQDVFALGRDGQLYPKHSIISAFLAVPFYAVFGEYGFLLFQEMSFFLLAYSVYKIINKLSDSDYPFIVLVGICLGTQGINYSYEFSYDMHATALIMFGLYLSFSRPFLGSIIINMAVFVRPSFLLLTIPLSFANYFYSCRRRSLIYSFTGTSFTLGVFLLINYLLWGAPLITAYSRLPRYFGETAIITSHPYGFDLDTFLSKWDRKLFSKVGLLPYNSAFLLLPFTYHFISYSRYSKFLFYSVLISGSYVLYMFSYEMWDASFYGNRFIMPAIYLYLIAVLAGMCNILKIRKITACRKQL